MSIKIFNGCGAKGPMKVLEITLLGYQIWLYKWKIVIQKDIEGGCTPLILSLNHIQIPNLTFTDAIFWYPKTNSELAHVVYNTGNKLFDDAVNKAASLGVDVVDAVKIKQFIRDNYSPEQIKAMREGYDKD